MMAKHFNGQVANLENKHAETFCGAGAPLKKGAGTLQECPKGPFDGATKQQLSQGVERVALEATTWKYRKKEKRTAGWQIRNF